MNATARDVNKTVLTPRGALTVNVKVGIGWQEMAKVAMVSFQYVDLNKKLTKA